MAEIKLSDKNLLYLRAVNVNIFGLVGDPRTIVDLRIKFECEKTNESSPNNAIVKIYNLKESTRSVLEQKGARVELKAGYKNTIATLFKGNVTKVVHISKPPDIITKVEVRDGDNSYRNSRVDKGYPPGVTTTQVIQELADEMNLPIGVILGVPNTQYANGLTLSGTVRDQLDYITKKNNLEWSIQDETLQIIPKQQFTAEAIIVLNPTTGLIGSPSKTKDGVEFNSLLQPKLRPGRRVKIESKFINGIFKIRKVNHEGDSLDGDFLSKCEAR